MISGIIKIWLLKGYQPRPSASSDIPYLDLDYFGYHKSPILLLFKYNITSKLKDQILTFPTHLTARLGTRSTCLATCSPAFSNSYVCACSGFLYIYHSRSSISLSRLLFPELAIFYFHHLRISYEEHRTFTKARHSEKSRASQAIRHLTVVCSVNWPLNASEVGVDFLWYRPLLFHSNSNCS